MYLLTLDVFRIEPVHEYACYMAKQNQEQIIILHNTSHYWHFFK